MCVRKLLELVVSIELDVPTKLLELFDEPSIYEMDRALIDTCFRLQSEDGLSAQAMILRQIFT